MADAHPEETAPAHEGEAQAKTRSRRRIFVRVAMVLVAVVIGILVSVLTVDLGPALRARAEKEGSNFIQRPMRIGRLSARLLPGVFVVEDLVIALDGSAEMRPLVLGAATRASPARRVHGTPRSPEFRDPPGAVVEG